MPTQAILTIQDDALPRPVGNASFNDEFPFAANTPGAPQRSEIRKEDKYRTQIRYNIVEHILKDVVATQRKNGVVCVSSYALTHPAMLDQLAKGNTLAVVQKFSPERNLTEKYAELVCAYRRDAFPSSILPYLIRRDGQNDCGLCEGLRMVGNVYQTSRLYQNEARPFMHLKGVYCLVPGSNGKLKLSVVFDGTANLSRNSESSFEKVTRTTHPQGMEILFEEDFAQMFSLSEGLYNFSQGISPTYVLNDKVRYLAPPKCAECGSQEAVVKWVPSFANPKEVERRLCCAKCGQQTPFIQEHVRRQR